MANHGFPGAEAVAGRVREHFVALAESDGATLGLVPETAVLGEILNAAFWASLRREEGYLPTLSLAFVPPEQSHRPMMLDCPIALAPEALAHLAPAVKQPGIHLAVWRLQEGLAVWGTTRNVPPTCFVLEVAGPGLLVIKHRRADESGKFTNVAVLASDEFKLLLQPSTGSGQHLPCIVKSLLGFDTQDARRAKLNVLEQLIVAMRAHNRGGALLVVPSNTDTWKESVVQPMRYAVSPAYSELKDLMAGDTAQGRFRRAVDTIAGLTVIDGATVITDQHELLAFGVKIVRRDGWPQVTRVIFTEPFEGATEVEAHPSMLGGTRHLSAAQFVQDQRDAVALVASQDGRFTIFSWSVAEDTLYAHRVDSLLM